MAASTRGHRGGGRGDALHSGLGGGGGGGRLLWLRERERGKERGAEEGRREREVIFPKVKDKEELEAWRERREFRNFIAVGCEATKRQETIKGRQRRGKGLVAAVQHLLLGVG